MPGKGRDAPCSTLTELLHAKAEATPDGLAYIFLRDGEGGEQSMTYRELHLRAVKIAHELSERGSRGDRVLVLYPPGLEYITAFFGCIQAGFVAVPAYLPQSPRGFDRLSEVFSAT